MHPLLEKLFSLGVSPENPLYLNNKIRLSNQLGLGLLIICILYSLFTLIYLPALIAFSVSALTLLGTTFFLNAVGAHYIARVMLSVLPVSVPAIYNAYLTPHGADPHAGLYLVELTLALTPFMLIDIRERNLLAGTALSCFFVVAGFELTNEWFDQHIEASIVNEAFFTKGSVIFAIVTAFTYLYVLVYYNYQAEEQSFALLAQMEERNEELKKSEKEMLDNMDRLRKAGEEEKQRAYITEGLSGLAAELRQQLQLAGMAEIVLKYIIKYTSAKQGGFYLINEGQGSDASIDMIACYAYDRLKASRKSFSIGEGLLGQAYLEKDLLFLTEIPQDYLSITSGLGGASPGCIIVIPLMASEKVVALWEIASFKEMAPYQVTFLTKAADAVAAVIDSALINEKTAKLLKETQGLAEQLYSQEEELRQNMEEMQATSEEMQRKEKELLERISELEDMLKNKKTNA